jgi:hypothetical protein
VQCLASAHLPEVCVDGDFSWSYASLPASDVPSRIPVARSYRITETKLRQQGGRNCIGICAHVMHEHVDVDGVGICIRKPLPEICISRQAIAYLPRAL